jgi:hypothetical protein
MSVVQRSTIQKNYQPSLKEDWTAADAVRTILIIGSGAIARLSPDQEMGGVSA